MKYAADFRKDARKALKGRWGTAVIASLIAALVGAVPSAGPRFNFDFDESGLRGGFRYLNREISVFNIDSEAFAHFFVILAVAALVTALVALFINVFLGGVVNVGYSRFQLDLVDKGKQPAVGTLFRYFSYWKNAALTMFLKGLFVVLWMVLFIVPGFIAAYSYAMTGYILAENPDMKAREAMRKSKEMMRGNRTRLFCLKVSFIGWMILSIMTLGIGNLWLMPYMYAAEAAFYRDLKKEKRQ